MTVEPAAVERPRCRSLRGVRILGAGGYVPEFVLTNDHLHERFGLKSEWIVRMTGIRERRHVLPHQAASDLCVEASRRCIEQAGVDPRDIDLLVLGTTTPDMSFPSTACLVQDRLQLVCPAMDLNAACAGFMYALITGAAYVVSGVSDLALIVGGEASSRGLDPDDVKTCTLFGDGAGAVLLARGAPDQGILSYSLGADGAGRQFLERPACGSRLPPTPELLAQGKHFMHMDGRGVFSWATGILCDSIQDVLDASGHTVDDVHLYIPHQANVRIINTAIDVLRIPRDRVFNNLDKYGNTSAGSVPLALDEALRDGRLKAGDLVVLSGFGAGLTWGTALLRW